MRRRRRSRLAQYRAERSTARRNPPLVQDLWEFILPGFGAFAASRFVSRVAATQVAKRWPKLGKHAGVAAAGGTFAAAWFLAHRWDKIAKYHTPAVVGSGLAFLQTLVQTYFPQFGWMVSDVTPDLPKVAAAEAAVKSIAPPQIIDHDEEADGTPSWYSYNDAYDSGRYAPEAQAPSTQGDDEGESVEDMLNQMGVGEEGYGGIFDTGSN